MAPLPGLSRRQFLRAGLSVAGITLLAACAPQAPAQPAATSAPAATTAPAATAAPAAAKPAESKPAEAKPAAPASTAAPAAAAKPAAAKPDQQLGSQLIGQLEGPTIVTDTAQYPKSFKEAPALAELVKAGKLPPVDQRVSADPLVIKPVHEIGKYGGTWRRGFTGPNTVGPGDAGSPGPATSGTASARPAARTTCCSGTTPARRSSRTSPKASRSRMAARRSSCTSARATSGRTASRSRLTTSSSGTRICCSTKT